MYFATTFKCNTNTIRLKRICLTLTTTQNSNRYCSAVITHIPSPDVALRHLTQFFAARRNACLCKAQHRAIVSVSPSQGVGCLNCLTNHLTVFAVQSSHFFSFLAKQIIKIFFSGLVFFLLCRPIAVNFEFILCTAIYCYYNGDACTFDIFN